jgi:hypothetical protein
MARTPTQADDETTENIGGFVFPESDEATDDEGENAGPIDWADKVLDISDYKTATGAAKAVHRFLSEDLGGGDAIRIYDREETQTKRDSGPCWTVSWEGGPGNWAIEATGGENIYGANGEFGHITGFHENSDVNAECYYSFDIQFFDW